MGEEMKSAFGSQIRVTTTLLRSEISLQEERMMKHVDQQVHKLMQGVEVKLAQRSLSETQDGEQQSSCVGDHLTHLSDNLDCTRVVMPSRVHHHDAVRRSLSDNRRDTSRKQLDVKVAPRVYPNMAATEISRSPPDIGTAITMAEVPRTHTQTVNGSSSLLSSRQTQHRVVSTTPVLPGTSSNLPRLIGRAPASAQRAPHVPSGGVRQIPSAVPAANFSSNHVHTNQVGNAMAHYTVPVGGCLGSGHFPPGTADLTPPGHQVGLQQQDRSPLLDSDMIARIEAVRNHWTARCNFAASSTRGRRPSGDDIRKACLHVK